jgi:hypothetical protein
MTSSPDPVRTACEKEIRADLLDDLDRANTVAEPQTCSDLMDEARLAIIALQADLIAAREFLAGSRNEVNYWKWIHGEKDKRLVRAEAERDSLRIRLQEAERAIHLAVATVEDGQFIFPDEEPYLTMKLALPSEPTHTDTGGRRAP